MNFIPKNVAIALLFVALPTTFAFAQTPQEVQAIIKDYNLPLLQEMENRFSEQAQREKAEAVALAQQRGLETRMTLEEGGVAELQYVLPDGTLIYYRTFNVDAALSTRTNHLNIGGSTGFNLDGQNMIAYVWDAGHARVTHQEYDGPGGNNRVSVEDADTEGGTQLNFHAAHVTGTIAASGVVANAKGMAPQSRVRGYMWNNDLAEATAAAANGMLISNHSYGYRSDLVPIYYFGAYITNSRDWDALQYNAPYYLMVVAAGNDGTTNYNSSPLNPSFPQYDKLTGHSVSKNTLVVANAQDANVNSNGDLISVNINSGSSQGPTDDYRIKPDITGNGTGVYSTYQNSDTAYNSISGTSMASPNVSGTLLLLQQHYNSIHSSYMRAATLKGLALHTADDAGMVGPDAIFGWGLLNAKRAAETITNAGTNTLVEELTLLPGQEFSITVDSDGINNLLASISWTDPAGTATTALNNTTPRLVNDLDIRVTQGATTYFPWRLTGVNTNANDGDNIRDPFERVDVTAASGAYTITVTHKGTLSGGSQNFSLIVTGITDVPVVCNAPTGISIDSITGSDADFVWTVSPTETLGYEWVVMHSGENPDVDTPLFAGLLPTGATGVSVSGLSPVTAYSFFIRANCDPDGFSLWAGVNFTTPCDIFNTFPFTETWEASSMTIACWSVQQVVGSGLWYLTNGEAAGGNPTTAYAGSRNARFESLEGTNTPISKIISPVFDFSSIPSAELNFFYAQEVWFGYQNELKVYYRISQSDPWVELAHYTANTPVWTEVTLQLPNLSTAYQIAFEGINNWGRANVIDEVSIRFSGYVYKDGIWSPENPEEVSTISDNILVVNGSTTLTEETHANHLLINSGATLRVGDVLRVNGNITNDGELIFTSDAGGTGQLDTFTGIVTGEVTVERYLPARRAFRFLSSAVTTTSTINANWQEGVNNTGTSFPGDNQNPNPDYGTHITGSNTGANGFDATSTVAASMFTLNNSTQSWVAVPNTNATSLEAGKAYHILIRGDRSINVTSNSATPTNTTLRATGDLHTGPFTTTDFSSAAGEYNFFGNPYPAVVDMNAVLAASTNINPNHYYIWDPTLGGDPTPGQPGGRGAYVTVSLPSGTSTGGSAANQYLQPGQGAFVQTLNNAAASLSFQESHKAVSQLQTQVFNIVSEIHLKLFGANNYATGATASDGLLIKFTEEGNNAITPEDAPKFFNQDENLATTNGDHFLSIESRALPEDQEVIPLFVNQYRYMSYIKELNVSHLDGVTAFLRDHYSGDVVALPNDETAVYAFTIDAAIPESTASNRFDIVFEEVVLNTPDFSSNTLVLFPNPVSGNEVFLKASHLANTTATVEVFNTQGQGVLNKTLTFNSNGLLRIDLPGMSAGLYILTLTDDVGEKEHKKLIVNK